MTVDSFNAFINKWVTPATIVVVFGAIVWGVQLNIATLQNSKAHAANGVAIDKLAERVTADEFTQQKTALLLQQVSANLARLEQAAAAHNAEAEKWKRQIIRNQDALKRFD